MCMSVYGHSRDYTYTDPDLTDITQVPLDSIHLIDKVQGLIMFQYGNGKWA